VQIIRRLEELGPALDELRRDGPLALVPTMGALHAGHLALIAKAKARAVRVAATIFVNPTQFGPGEDLDRYPRQEQADSDMLAAAGCDLLWLPAVADIYPDGLAANVRVAGLSDHWEGEARPGHFDGVATVVARLLLTVRPDIAVFGEKDYQQLAVIRRLRADLRIPCEIVGVPTVRDRDGLALSSRNFYLSADERQRALALPKALQGTARTIASGAPIGAALAKAKQSLVEAGFLKVDYFALVDAVSLEPLEEGRNPMRLIAAATIGRTRLIDNIPVEMDSFSEP
jgi:pantoate--beta-alanine ligase